MSEPVVRAHESAPASPALPPDSAHVSGVITTRMRDFFKTCIKYKASDLLIQPGSPARIRLRGELKKLEAAPFTPEEIDLALQQMLTPGQLDHLKRDGAVDVAYDFDDDNRFRVNIYLARGRTSLAARRVSSEILSYADLMLPPVLEKIAAANHGLILVCGITGSGKSTTIASMVQQINLTRNCHIVTVEDPIEFIFKDGKAIVSQREIGVDVPDFAHALRVLVRENPDVVMIGELRDRETFEAAVHAAETGHLVFGTVHASSASQAFGRIYNLFPPEERELIREMFAANLKAIIYQKLLKTLRADIDRVPAVEILLHNPVVEKYIRDSREADLPDVIRNSHQEGMQDLSTSLVELVQKEYIHPRDAMAAAHNSDELKMRLKGIQASGGGGKSGGGG